MDGKQSFSHWKKKSGNARIILIRSGFIQVERHSPAFTHKKRPKNIHFYNKRFAVYWCLEKLSDIDDRFNEFNGLKNKKKKKNDLKKKNIVRIN